MTYFGQLPFVILNHILRIAIDTEERTLNVWADNLPLLGVCHEWREVAMGLVYCCAILEGSSELSNGFVEPSEDKTGENKLIHTNIGLIKDTGNTHLVKTLFFKANKYQYCQSLVDNVHSIFSFEKCDWNGVSEIVTNGWLEASDDDGDESHSNIAQQFVELIAENMPNVSKLDTWTSDKDAFGIFRLTNSFYLQNRSVLGN
ncbi:hypothetical protein BX661DRAFT_203814 [Kickxella alabastrina]|uniref:uncharacterized protein n=1 Tax=Kickxella alabastrina TaxID=61397 RepID=UPI00221F5B6F|nr:uncharacterized protein BX661DRAFT_203814 [Kickxella alabastrina]KAI7833519.1 hypothetical protein BX661DRAFT_203814 [Kickxella alabastrina]